MGVSQHTDHRDYLILEMKILQILLPLFLIVACSGISLNSISNEDVMEAEVEVRIVKRQVDEEDDGNSESEESDESEESEESDELDENGRIVKREAEEEGEENSSEESDEEDSSEESAESVENEK